MADELSSAPSSGGVGAVIRAWAPVVALLIAGVASYASLRAEVAELGRRVDRVEASAREQGTRLDDRLRRIEESISEVARDVAEIRGRVDALRQSDSASRPTRRER